MSVTTVAEEIAELTYVTRSSFDPPHGVTDPGKVVAIAGDMAVHGWRGAPIVVDGGDGGWALTGTHRLAAVRHALYEMDEAEVPVEYVEIGDLCRQYGIDWTALLLDEHDGDTYQAAAALRFLLPREVVDYLGFDVDGAI